MTPDQQQAAWIMTEYAAGYAFVIVVLAGLICKALERWLHR